MRILIVNTSTGGGAGIAARRQAEALRALGHDAQLLSLVNDWQATEVTVERDGLYVRLRVPGHKGAFNSAVAAAYCSGNRTPLSDTWFSLWPVSLPFDDAFVQVASGYDVVHLHWVSHLVSTRSLRALAARGVRLALTGHDMNPFTGGCHYTGGCERYRTGCSGCEQLVNDPLQLVEASYAAKCQAVQGLPMAWLFPSRWLADAFEQSALGATQMPAHVVRNCIDVDHWQPLAEASRQTVRTRLGFAETDIVLVAGAQNNAERRKGFDFIEDALAVIERRLPEVSGGASVIVVTFGHGAPEIAQRSPWLQHVHLGARSEDELPDLFGAADLLLFPSREENFSNTILEALLCGCPVIGFDIGGVPEAVADGVNGIVVPNLSAGAFCDALAPLLAPGRLPALRTGTLAWRAANAERFSPAAIARELVAIYGKLPAGAAQAATADTATSATSLWADLCDAADWPAARAEPVQAQLRHVSSPAARGRFHVGACKPERHPEWGQIQWITQDARMYFPAAAGAACALVLQVWNRGFPASLLERLPSTLRVSLDGRNLPFRVVADAERGAHAYLVASATVGTDVLHRFALTFSSLAVEPARDARQLCLLASAGCVVTGPDAATAERWDAADCALHLLRCGASATHGAWPDAAAGTEAAWLDIVGARNTEPA